MRTESDERDTESQREKERENRERKRERTEREQRENREIEIERERERKREIYKSHRYVHNMQKCNNIQIQTCNLPIRVVSTQVRDPG